MKEVPPEEPPVCDYFSFCLWFINCLFPGGDISIVKAMDALKGGAAEKRQIKLNLKNPVGVRKPEISDIARKTEALQGKKRPANSPPPIDPKSKKATSRREELLKQLKAVEDAIAKKRSKVN